MGSRVRAPRAAVARVGEAVTDLLSREFTFSTGHLTALLNGCLFAPSLLTFWFVNGVVDFSTALLIGAVATPAGLQVRLLAYALLVPTFLALRMGVHLAHPRHRREVLSGACPDVRYLSLDWFSVGILATGLPLALQTLGPWVAANAVFVVGVFVLPRLVPERGTVAKVAALVGGSLLFLYASYGGAVPLLPPPAAVVGPVATLRLSTATTTWLMRVVNSLVLGPVVVAGIAIVTNHVLTRPELRDVPVLRVSLPERDPETVVVLSAATGTALYLAVAGIATGQFVIVP